uniref:Uncharacterized protein n=1 Tax=Peronospora matthiolae TaxID=2874970 RepID=A0AAV1VGU3_9STRA
MMDQLKEQSKKASEKLEDLSKKTQKEMEKMQKELEKTSKKAQKSIEKTGKQTKDSVNKAMKETRDSVNKAVRGDQGRTESSGSSLLHSTKEAVHIEVKGSEKKVKRGRRKDSSDEEDGLLDDIGDDSTT